MESVKFNATFTWLPSPSMFLPKSPPLWGHSPVSWAGTMVPQGAGGCHNPEVTHLWAGQTQWCHRGPGGCRGLAASHEVPAAIAAPPGLGSASTGPAAESAAGNAPGRWRCPPWWGGHWPWEGGHFSAEILYKSRGPPRSFTPRRPSLTSNSALCSPRSWTPTLSLESCWQTATETMATKWAPWRPLAGRVGEEEKSTSSSPPCGQSAHTAEWVMGSAVPGRACGNTAPPTHDGETRGPSIHWSITQPWTEVWPWHSQPRERTLRTWCSVREADTEGHTDCDSTDGTRPEQADPRHREWVPGCQGLGRGWEWLLMRREGFLLGWWKLLELEVIVAQLCSKCHFKNGWKK